MPMIYVKIFLIAFVLEIMAITSVFAAEGFFDLYLGPAYTNDSFVWVEQEGWYGYASASENVSFDPSFTFGLRGGGWSESIRQIGWAIDAFYIQADSEEVDISGIPLSISLMLRLPLFVRDEFPGGKLQPYFGFGPSFYFYDLDIDFQTIIPEKLSHTDIELGFQCQAGLLWQFHKEYGLFVEYRYTTFSIDEDWDIDNWFSPDEIQRAKIDIDTHHFLVGISFRF
jgi:hypothetical protein